MNTSGRTIAWNLTVARILANRMISRSIMHRTMDAMMFMSSFAACIRTVMTVCIAGRSQSGSENIC